MNILILGGGGREHALAMSISKSPLCSKLFIAPGNAGTALCGQNVILDHNNFNEIERFVLNNEIGFVVIGPEGPIVSGIADYFKSNKSLKNILLLAPSSKGARLEGSKNFAKEFLSRHNIPTAKYKSFDSSEYDDAKKYILSGKLPVVIKADGLAAGKGVVICYSTIAAVDALDDLFVKKIFGKSGERVVIEEYLEGIELSVFVLTDGNNYLLLPSAKDYKRIGEGDSGPNTGGMGCVSPVPFATEAFMKKVKEKIIVPTINGIKKEKLDYKGFLFFGLINSEGNPFVIEYNVRLGDPESEVILPRINDDLLPLMLFAAKGTLASGSVNTKKEFCVTVILASGGYPGSFEKGKLIKNLEEPFEGIIFHSGTTLNDGQVYTSGGRVLCVTSLDMNLQRALEKSYYIADKIYFENKYYRKDIGLDLMKYI